MYKAHAVSTDYWRHFIPFAPDYTVEFLMGEEFSLSLKDVMVQGARDFDTGISPDPTVVPIRMPVQRGWLLDVILGDLPQNLLVSVEGKSLKINTTATASVKSNQYCFNYQFSNGYQASNYGKINVIYVVPYPLTFDINALDPNVYYPDATEGTYNLSLRIAPPSQGYYRSAYYHYEWHIVQPEVVETINGVDYIDEVDSIFHQTTFVNTGTQYLIIDPGTSLNEYTVTTDSHLVGIDKRTGLSYINKHKFPSIYVVYKNYNNLLPPHNMPDLENYEQFTYYVENQLGKYWYKSSAGQF